MIRSTARLFCLLALAPALLRAGAVAPPESPFTVRLEPAATAVAVPGVGRFDAATGAARRLFDLGFIGSAEDPVGTARAYLDADAVRLGRAGADPVETLEPRAVVPGRASTVVRFAQRLGGLPVHGGEIAVAVGPDGRVAFVSSSYRPGLSAPRHPIRLDGAAALDAALAHLGTTRATTLALERVVVPVAGETRVAWRARIDPAGAPEGDWEVLVDAESGAVLAAEDKLLYADATGKAFDPDPLSSARATYGATGFVDGADADTAQLTAQTFDRTLRDVTFAGGVYSLVGPWAECLDWDTPVGTCPTSATGVFADTRASDNFEGVNVYHHIDSLLRYLNVTLGLSVHAYQYAGGTRYDPRGFQGQDNSSYNSGTGRLRFGEGGVDDAEDADVVIHELGHGIHDWVTAGGLSQVEGLSEGTGDYFAGSYSRSYAGQWTPADPQYYWTFSWDGHNPFWSGRVTNWDDTHTYPADLTGSIHTDGQFWASCSLRIWEVIGRDLADAAMVEGLRMTGSSTDQEDAAQAVLQAAWNMGYGPSALQVIQLEYNSANCNYGVVMPTSPDSIFFDGYETQDFSRWSGTGG